MDLIKEDLKNKSEEIDQFLELLEFIENTESIANSTKDTYNVDARLKNTLKGVVFLLLYNLTEATMRESISHIHDKMDEKAVEFNRLKETIRKEILQRAKSDKIGLDQLLKNTSPLISINLARATFNEKNLFSGNIDQDEIKKKADIYGFNSSTDYKKTKHGERLKTIKQKRNDLAHGNSSFSEVGRNYTTNELSEFVREVVAYLSEITTSISLYVSSQNYLDNSEI
jgi:hypothetical protein